MSISLAKILLACLLFIPMFIFFCSIIKKIINATIEEAKKGNVR